MKNIPYGPILASILVVSVFVMIDSTYDASAYKSKKNSSFLKSVDTAKTQLNKFSNYIHLQQEWNSYPSNIIFDVSVFWKNDNSLPHTESFGGANNRINNLQYLGDKSYVEVQYDYLDCDYQWIHYIRYGLDVLNSKMDYWSGRQLGSEYDSALFVKIPGTESPSRSDSPVFLQFIPLCTSKDMTSFEYGIRINDKNIGFDVYFVPSIQERLNFLTDEGFEYYAGEECSGLGYTSFSGTCTNVGQDSGLLIVIPDKLEKPLTKVSVKLKEVKHDDPV